MQAALGGIELNSVSRRFGRRYALHRVSMSLAAGELALVLGPNGAGKSTLLRVLATLDRPSKGDVLYRGWGTHAEVARAGRGHIGWLGEESLLYGELTVFENLKFSCDLHGIDEAGERIEQCLGWFGLKSELGASQALRTYSSGIRRRVSLARVFLHGPQLLLLDEPLAGLDSSGREKLIEVLARMRGEGMVLVLSTHDLRIPEELIDRVYILDEGRLGYGGPSRQPLGQLYERVLAGERGLSR